MILDNKSYCSINVLITKSLWEKYQKSPKSGSGLNIYLPSLRNGKGDWERVKKKERVERLNADSNQ